MRIATWNVERPKPNGWKIPPAQLRRMAEVDADIWVLTETHLDHAPSPDHRYSAFSPPHPERRPIRERWVAIWSRWPLTPVEDPPPHRRGSLAATILSPEGSVLVYGCVIAWHGEREFDDGTPAKNWEVHHAEVERQTADWMHLHEQNPNLPFVIAGDFNQQRAGGDGYGTARSRQGVTDALGATGLVCVTSTQTYVAADGTVRPVIDHLCVSQNLADSITATTLNPIDKDGITMSDHPTLVMDLIIPPK